MEFNHTYFYIMLRLRLRSNSFNMVPLRSQPPSYVIFWSSRQCRLLWSTALNSTFFSRHQLTNVVPSSSVTLILRKFSAPLSPFDPNHVKAPGETIRSETSTKTKKRHRTFIPQIAAVQLTDKARMFFKQLLENPIRPDIIGIMLNYDQSKSGEPRMVYTFNFVTHHDIDPEEDEGVSLEMIPSIDPSTREPILIPKPPVDSRNDGLPKLYIHHHAFLKVLGSTIDVDTETITPILYDREGNRMDPNA